MINRMYLFAATSYGDIFTPPEPTIWRGTAHHLPGADQRGNHLALLLPGQQRVPGAMGGLEQSPDPGERAKHSGVVQHPRRPDAPTRICRRSCSSSVPAPPARTSIPATTFRRAPHVVQQIMTPLLTSTAWPDSVFILSYDEGGGTYRSSGADTGHAAG